MATLTLEEQNWYRNNIAQQANQASDYVQERVLTLAQNQLRNNGYINVANMRNNSIELVNSAVDVFGENAKAISNELFDYTMQIQNSSIQAQFYENDFDEDFIIEKIRYLAGTITSDSVEIFAREVSSYINYLVWRSGFANSWKNAKFNRLRFARIPSGNKTCAFCYMLASRGFVYHSEESAGGGFFSYHKNCDCEVISNAEGNLTVEGYDLDEIRSDYKEARRRAEENFDYRSGKSLTNDVLRELKKIMQESSSKG